MKGSAVKNIKIDPTKQKIIECIVCGKSMVVGKFAKKDQKCEECSNPTITNNKNGASKEKSKETFPVRLANIAKQLDFSVSDRRIWRKKYAMNDGGIANLHIMVGPDVGGKPKLEYFSYTTQRAVGVNEEFRKFMPPDIASDCELLAVELGEIIRIQPKLGQVICDGCGEPTDQYGVDTKRGRNLCIKPNNCFKKKFNSIGAQAEA